MRVIKERRRVMRIIRVILSLAACSNKCSTCTTVRPHARVWYTCIWYTCMYGTRVWYTVHVWYTYGTRKLTSGWFGSAERSAKNRSHICESSSLVNKSVTALLRSFVQSCKNASLSNSGDGG